MYQVLLYYKYVSVDDPEQLRLDQIELCKALNLKGRIIVATEGINGTLEGEVEDTEKYIEAMKADPRFVDVWFKRSSGTGSAFPKLSVKDRPEIVATHIDGLDPTKQTGKYLSAEDLHEWIHTGKKFYILDMRNDYEHKSGYFEGSILSPIESFWKLDQIPQVIKDLKDETIVTVCTGGVRCEKGSAYLLSQGFSDVFQLHGGIVTYMEKYPNEDFLGKLYVFDNRLVMGFNTESSEHVVVGTCEHCGVAADSYANCAYNFCHRHYISCLNCRDADGLVFCNDQCRENYEKQKIESKKTG